MAKADTAASGIEPANPSSCKLWAVNVINLHQSQPEEACQQIIVIFTIYRKMLAAVRLGVHLVALKGKGGKIEIAFAQLSTGFI